MQKKLLALAIAGALSAPLAAQAQNVQIYGVLKPSVDFVDNGDTKGTTMQDNNSRLGFKGSEDLGGGLKAIFQIESAINFPERDGTLARRDSWVGISGGFGSIVVGNMFPAYKRSTDFVDPMGDTLADYNNIVGVPLFDADGFNDRFTNAFHYASPDFGGFKIEATYGLNGDVDGDGHETDDGISGGPDADDDAWSLAATYKAGALTVAAAYEDQENRIGEDTRAYKIAAGFKVLPTTSINAMFAVEDFGEVAGVSFERNVWVVSGKHTMGSIDLMASFIMADDFDDVDDSGAKGWGLGAKYNFSKRTSIGLYYAEVRNDDNAGYGFDSGHAPGGGNDPVADLGEDMKGLSVQMVHSF